MACIGPRWRGWFVVVGAYWRSVVYGMREKPFRVHRLFSSWRVRWRATIRDSRRLWIETACHPDMMPACSLLEPPLMPTWSSTFSTREDARSSPLQLLRSVNREPRLEE